MWALVLLVACHSRQQHANDTSRMRASASDVSPSGDDVQAAWPTLDIGLASVDVPIRLRVGQALQIRLPASVASGCGWQLQDPPLLLSIEADPGGDPLSLARLRSDSRFMSWRFRATDTGSTSLKFRYVRPWEMDRGNGRTETFHIEVR
jgi:predicted secreted protein